AIRAVLAIARRRDVDETRIQGGCRLVIEAEARHDPRTEVLDEDVRLLDQAARDGLALGVLQVQGEAPLAPMSRQEEGGHAVEVEVAPCQFRSQSFPPGGSILITSAPRSARNWTPDGPSRNGVKLRPRTPDRIASGGGVTSAPAGVPGRPAWPGAARRSRTRARRRPSTERWRNPGRSDASGRGGPSAGAARPGAGLPAGEPTRRPRRPGHRRESPG